MLWRSLKIDNTLLQKAIFDLFHSTLCELVGPFDPSVQICLHCDKTKGTPKQQVTLGLSTLFGRVNQQTTLALFKMTICLL